MVQKFTGFWIVHWQAIDAQCRRHTVDNFSKKNNTLMSFSSVSGKWIWLADSQSYSVLFQPRLLGTEIALFLTIKIPYFVQYIMNSINKK